MLRPHLGPVLRRYAIGMGQVISAQRQLLSLQPLEGACGFNVRSQSGKRSPALPGGDHPSLEKTSQTEKKAEDQTWVFRPLFPGIRAAVVPMPPGVLLPE